MLWVMSALKSSPHRTGDLLVFSWETRTVVPVLPGSFRHPSGCALYFSKTLAGLKSPTSGGRWETQRQAATGLSSSGPGVPRFPVGPCRGRVCRRRGKVGPRGDSGEVR